MSREVRMVPANWEHPKGLDGAYQPLYEENYQAAADDWMHNCLLWYAGQHQYQKKYPSAAECKHWWEWSGPPPEEQYHMPVFAPEDRTHWQMYETCSEGTPISPPMETAELLAHWLADNKASAFAEDTATYEQWLAAIQAGWAPSAIIQGGELKSGVAAAGDK